jgi:hypothetical protein
MSSLNDFAQTPPTHTDVGDGARAAGVCTTPADELSSTPSQFDDAAIAPVGWVTTERGRVVAIDVQLPSGEVVEMLPDSLTTPGATNVRQDLLQWVTWNLLHVKNLAALRIRLLNELASVKAVRIAQRALPDDLHAGFLDRLFHRSQGLQYTVPCRRNRGKKKESIDDAE